LYNESTERALLGSLMIKPENLDLAQKWIEHPNVFYYDFHRHIWETILSLNERGEHIDMVTVTHNYPQKKSIDKNIAYFPHHSEHLDIYSNTKFLLSQKQLQKL